MTGCLHTRSHSIPHAHTHAHTVLFHMLTHMLTQYSTCTFQKRGFLFSPSSETRLPACIGLPRCWSVSGSVTVLYPNGVITGYPSNHCWTTADYLPEMQISQGPILEIFCTLQEKNVPVLSSTWIGEMFAYFPETPWDIEKEMESESHYQMIKLIF